MNIEQLSQLISLRNFAHNCIDNLSFTTKPGEVNVIARHVAAMDRIVLDNILALDLNTVRASKLDVHFDVDASCKLQSMIDYGVLPINDKIVSDKVTKAFEAVKLSKVKRSVNKPVSTDEAAK